MFLFWSNFAPNHRQGSFSSLISHFTLYEPGTLAGASRCAWTVQIHILWSPRLETTTEKSQVGDSPDSYLSGISLYRIYILFKSNFRPASQIPCEKNFLFDFPNFLPITEGAIIIKVYRGMEEISDSGALKSCPPPLFRFLNWNVRQVLRISGFEWVFF